MNTILASLAIATFSFFPNGDYTGTTTTGIPFNGITVMEQPRIQKFQILNEYWYVCNGGAMESLKDLSICISQ
jgi:hypothetical protein